MAKNKYLSPTAINTYLRCPRKYYLKYIKKLKTKPSIHLIKGMAVHEALKNFYSQDITLDSEISTLRLRLLQYFQIAWEKQKKLIRQLDMGHKTLETHYKDCIHMLYGWFFRFAEKASLGLAKPRTEVKLFSKKHMLMGIIDAIYCHNDMVVLVDYKTAQKDELTEEIRVQMGLYTLLYRENYQRLPDILCVDFLATGTKKYFKASQDLADSAEKLVELIHSKTASENQEDYPCLCGGWCEKDFENDGTSNQVDTAKD